MEVSSPQSPSPPQSLDSDHWTMSRLPPFFTLQPVPATLQKQMALWANVLLEHAVFRSSTAQSPKESPLIRLYTPNSDIFTHTQLHRTLPSDAALQVLEYVAERFPSHCALVAPTGGTSEATLLVTAASGGLEAHERAIYHWIMEESANATTATDLNKTGVVLTFDEIVDGSCLYYESLSGVRGALSIDADRLRRVTSNITEEFRVKRSGAASDEEVARIFLHFLSGKNHVTANGSGSASLRSYRVRMFNLDGSSEPPYEGVKIGG